MHTPPPNGEGFKKAFKDLRYIFISSFLIHLIGAFMVDVYIIIALGWDIADQEKGFIIPVIASGFIISFIAFYLMHKNLIGYFYFKKDVSIELLQQEILNFPKMSVFGFGIWALAGLVFIVRLIHIEAASTESIVLHISFASFLSGSIVAILQLNITESLVQRNLFPFLLGSTRISEIKNIIKIPSYIRIQLLVITTAILPSVFIYLLYEKNEASGAILLYVLAFTVFNAFWQGGFLLRAISQPIGQIAGKLERFRNGELEEQSKPLWRTDALGEFSEMFDDMVSSINERDFIRDTFSRYIDPSLVDDILNGGDQLGGSDIEASIMFADIRGFTSLSEQLRPEEVVELLNGYFEDMVQEIAANDGIPDKFLGDGLMAVWGVPGGDPNHAQKSCQAAIAMLDRLKKVNESRTQKGEKTLRIGIGIHSGPVIAGNIGSKKKMEYTVIGDTVNTSSRIEGMCKTLAADLLISSEVYEKLSKAMQSKFTFAKAEQLRGRSSETQLYRYLAEH